MPLEGSIDRSELIWRRDRALALADACRQWASRHEAGECYALAALALRDAARHLDCAANEQACIDEIADAKTEESM